MKIPEPSHSNPTQPLLTAGEPGLPPSESVEAGANVSWRQRDARTEHLIALVHDGATLEDAARAYGISAERVRQILREGGMSARDLPGRSERGRTRRFAPTCELAPVVEAMWREGMLCHEIAKVLDVSGEAAHALITERVPTEERELQATARVVEQRSDHARLLDGVRRAARLLADSSTIHPAHRLRAQARVDGWLAAHVQLTPADQAPPKPSRASAQKPSNERFAAADLRTELERFRATLRAGGLRESTINAYFFGSSLFVRWLAGEYEPRGNVR